MKINFCKYQGAGNDFVLIDARRDLPFSLERFAVVACDRHFGIGADGVIALGNSSTDDFKMTYINADGSEAVCGNGMRCISKFILDLGLLAPGQSKFSLETCAGSAAVEMLTPNSFRVKMNVPTFEGREIPTAEAGEHLEHSLHVGESEWVVTTVGMGNPHAVLFVDSVKSAPVRELGPKMEHHPFFPKRTNVEFVEILSSSEFNLRVWERGVGETLACGTGICAAVAAGVRLGKCGRDVLVHAPGGDFQVFWDENSGAIYLTGPAELVFSGEFEIGEIVSHSEKRDVSGNHHGAHHAV